MNILRSLFAIIALFSVTVASGEEDRPNILFCIADDASWPHMSAYGCEWVQTPAFDTVARKGRLFNNAYTPNAKCAPSRACILTGRNSWQLEEACNHHPIFPTKFRVYTEVLRQAGYTVGRTGKGWAPGKWDYLGLDRPPLLHEYNDQKEGQVAFGIDERDYAANFEAFLEDRSSDAPFFFWFGPHTTPVASIVFFGFLRGWLRGQ